MAIADLPYLVLPGKLHIARRTLVDVDGRPIGKVDQATNATATVDYPHSEIHGGSHYYVQGFVELATDGTFYVKLVTPNTGKWSHFTFDIQSTGITTTVLDEDATGGMAGGVGIIPINNNRNSLNTSGMVLTGGVTVNTGHTVRLEDDKWGIAGVGKAATGGGTTREDELVLKQNTVYLRCFGSLSDDNIIQFRARWYEHTDAS